jgi:O-antigen/teichoic acid export membrane protein
MSLKGNIVANYLSQAYVTVAGIALVPLYLGYMGAEAYGLVGFFTMMNAWFALLDVGLTPTLSREVARFRGGALDAATLRGLVRVLELVFGVIAVIAAAAFLLGSAPIARDWLNVEALPLGEVRQSVVLMGLIIPLRWMSGLYRGAVNGFERQIWLGGFNVGVATARFVGVIAIFHLVGTSPVQFFAYQLVVAGVELAGLAAMTHRLLPKTARAQGVHAAWRALRGILSFSLTIAFTGAVWVLITQTDKLVLSKLLPLADYGYFSLAAIVAGGVMTIGAPVAQAVLPRLAKLSAEGRHDAALALYRTATQLVCLLAVPAAAMLSVFAKPILLAWTGDPYAAEQAAPVLRLYAAGNGILVLTALAYYLQYARGNLRLHLIGNALMLVLYVPVLVWCAMHWGAVGAGWAWTVAIGLYFLLWVPLVHGRLEPGLHVSWMLRDVLPVSTVAIASAVAVASVTELPVERATTAAAIVVLGMLVLALSAMASSVARGLLFRRFRPVSMKGRV